MNEKIKKHKESSEYKSALMKFSAVIWLAGISIFLTLSLLSFIIGFKNPTTRWGGLGFTALFLWQLILRIRVYKIYKYACMGYGLGLDVDNRMLKEIRKSKNKIIKQQTKMLWNKTYLSQEGLEMLKKEEEKEKTTEEKKDGSGTIQSPNGNGPKTKCNN